MGRISTTGFLSDRGYYRADIHDSRFYSHPHGNGIQSKGGQNGVNIYNNVIYNNYLGGISIIQNETWALTANIYNNIIYNNNDGHPPVL